MQNNTQLALTQVITRHLLSYQHDTGVSMLAFAADVRLHYESTVAVSSRLVEWSSLPDFALRMQRDAGTFSRWLDHDSAARLPADLIESTIAAFPPDRRLLLQIELASRQGLRIATIPKDTAADIATLGDLGRTHGQAICALADIFADGKVDAQDKPFAPKALASIDQAISVLMSMRELIVDKVINAETSHA